jgi:hypothetical protein
VLTFTGLILGPVNRGGAVGDQKGDQLGNLLGIVGAADGNPAQRIHQPLARNVLVDSALLGEAEDLARIRAFYADKTGLHPALAGEIRLRDDT